MEKLRNISSEEAIDWIFYNQILKNSLVSGKMEMEVEIFNHDIIIDNCVINYFKGTNVQYQKPVKFKDSKFKNCDFSFSFFVGGLEVINCSFEGYLDFQCGGHNKNNNSINLENSTFKDFVNFYDCSFEGPVILKGNDFQKGTNIFGNKGMPYETGLKTAPIIENNKGQMNIDGEGKESI
jgi:hypothetical protein